MKTPNIRKSTTTPSSKPFFRKPGEGSFFSPTKTSEKPFLSPSFGGKRSLTHELAPIVQQSIDQGQPIIQKDGEEGEEAKKQNVSGKVSMRAFPTNEQVEMKGSMNFPLPGGKNTTGTIDSKVGIKEPKKIGDTESFGGGNLGLKYKLHKRFKTIAQVGILYKDGKLLSTGTAGADINLGLIHPELTFLTLEPRASLLAGKTGFKGAGEVGLRAQFSDNFSVVGGITVGSGEAVKPFVQMNITFDWLSGK